MTTVRMSLRAAGTGKRLAAHGKTADAVIAAENFRAVLQDRLLPVRRELGTTCDPARTSFFKPDIKPTPEGAEMEFTRPAVVDAERFDAVVDAAIERFRERFPTPLLVY